MNAVQQMSDILFSLRRMRLNLKCKSYTWFEKELMIQRLTQLRHAKKNVIGIQPLKHQKTYRHENSTQQ